MKFMTRRQFMVNYSLAAGALLGTGAIPFGLVPPRPVFAEDIKLIESTCKNIGKKILVVYESFCGSTAEVARCIADIFCKKGAQVDLFHVGSVTEISSYDGVVIGSAVKSASWYPSMIDFVKENQHALKQIPVAYFLTCLALYKNTEDSRKLANSYFNPVLTAVPGIKPETMQAFAGKLDYSKMNMMFRMVMKSKMKEKGIPEGDFRDFRAIETWAGNTVWPSMMTA